MDIQCQIERFKERFKQLDKARKLQAKEYERRLESLNGEAARLRNMQETYTPREVFDNTTIELRKAIKDGFDSIDKTIEDITVWKTQQQGKSQLLQYIPWILMIIALVFTWLTYNKK